MVIEGGMAEEPRIATLDVAEIERWLNDPDAPIGELREQFPFLRSDAHARRFLAEIKEGLEDVAAGRVVSHEEVRKDVEERRRRHRPSAAE
jgi:predicted transcriptional regulator